jgi:protein TonB
VPFRTGVLVEPTKYPDKPVILVDPPPQVASGSYVIGGGPGDSQGSFENGILGGILAAGAPPLPRPRISEPRPALVATAPSPVVKQVPVGGRVKMAEVVHRVEPLYPPLARQARVQGVVELVGVIATDGHLKELRLVSGHPLLAHAALEAVSQWIYRPTTLNGEPVEVIAPITVTFRLN